MHLESDSFTIIYDPTKVSVAAILEKIRGLGYKPQEIAAVKPADDPQTAPTKPLPELIASALAAAVEEDKLLLLDFYAGWCAPCKVLEKKVLTNADVKQALESFRLFKVDTDRYPEVAEYFKIRALPTLVVLDKEAANRYRHMGIIDADDLVRKLVKVSKPRQHKGAH
jgi:thioredoxin 1